MSDALERYKYPKIQGVQDKSFQEQFELYLKQHKRILKALPDELPEDKLIAFSEEDEQMFHQYALISSFGKDYGEFVEEKSNVSLMRLELPQLERIGRIASLTDMGVKVIRFACVIFIISSFFAVLLGLLFQIMPIKSILALVFLTGLITHLLFTARDSSKHIFYRLVKEDHLLRNVFEDHKIVKQLEHDKD